MNHLVSIIMPCFNAEKFLRRAIDSVLAQSYATWELLITDDRSLDDSLSIAQNYAKGDNRIFVFTNEYARGAAGSRNTSLDHAQGRFIAFLDSDDQWKPFHLEERIQHMLENNYAFTYSWFERIDENAQPLRPHTLRRTKTSYRSLLTDCIIGCLVAIYDAEKIGILHMPNMQKRQDFGMWLQILKKTDYAYCYPKITAVYTLRKSSVSSNKLALIKHNWAIYRKLEGFGLCKSLFYFGIFLVRNVSRKLFNIGYAPCLDDNSSST